MLSFFSLGLLFPFHYPVREVVTLGFWILAFPSRAGYLAFFLLPLFPSATSGYFAFNLFCVLATLGTAWSFAHWAPTSSETAGRLHRFTRSCLAISIVIAFWQCIDGEKWMQIFPEMFAVGNGRGAGLRTEPSLLASPLVLYLGFALWKYLSNGDSDRGRTRLQIEIAAFALATIVATESLTVVIVVLCFLPTFRTSLKGLIGWTAGGSLLSAAIFADRIRDALLGYGGFTYIITTAFGSWRNVPDIVILSNPQAFLLPQNPEGVRDKISSLCRVMGPTLWMA